MLYKTYFLFFCLGLAFPFASFSQKTAWVKKDEKLIKEFVERYKKDSLEAIHFFSPSAYRRDTTILGLEYYTVEVKVLGGYVKMNAKFLYRGDSLLEYKISSEMPDEIELREIYKEWYAPAFAFKDSFDIRPIYSNYENWISPFSTYNGPLKVSEQSELFQRFISTESGDIFGYYNGWYGLHLNRALFGELIPTLDTGQIYLLMFSKNPISRLQAFYYYLTHEDEFSANRKVEVKYWMEQIVNDPDKIFSSEGDVIGLESSKERLMYYVNIDLEREKNPDLDTCDYFGLGSFGMIQIKSDHDSLSYNTGCPLTGLELFILDRHGRIMAAISEPSNPLKINLSEKVVKNEVEEFKYGAETYFWTAQYSYHTPAGIVTKQAQSSIRILR